MWRINVMYFIFISILFSKTQCNNAHEKINVNKLIEEINKKIDPTVDADYTQLASAYHSGNICPFRHKVFSKIMKSEPVEVYIIGGSVTFGSELKDTASQRWSTKFKKNLNNGWINSSINIHNIAVPACRVESWLHKVNEVRHADLVIVDLSVNDQGLKLKELPHLYRAFIQLITDLPNHPAIYFHQAYRTSNFDRSNLMKYCPNENEQAECCDGYLWCKRWWLMQDSVAKALKSFQIPFASYRDLVWPAYASPPKALPQFWNGLSHPDYKAHNLIAKLMTFAFMMQFREAQANYHNHNHSESESKFETMRINCYPSYDVNNGVDVDVEEAYLYNFTGFSFSEREREREIDHTNKVGAASTLTKKIRPVCRNHTHLTSMIANDQADSKNNFALASPITNWKFYDDSKSKFGYIIQAKLTDITNLCNKKASKSSLAGEEEFNHMSGKYINMGGKYNHIGEWCNEATNFTQISFPVEFGNDNPILQISFLKSDDIIMGSIVVWVDDVRSINVTIDSHWDLPYSVTHFTTISQKHITDIDPNLVLDATILPSLSAGHHVINIALAPFTEEISKWKLLGISSC